MPNTELDAIDRRILAVLQENARVSNVELAEASGISASPASTALTGTGVVTSCCHTIRSTASSMSRVVVNPSASRAATRGAVQVDSVPAMSATPSLSPSSAWGS